MSKNIRLLLCLLLAILRLNMVDPGQDVIPEDTPVVLEEAISLPAETAAPVITVAVDRPEQTLTWGMDTCVNYTVTTPADCVEVSIGQLTVSQALSDDMSAQGPEVVIQNRTENPSYYTETINEQSFTRAEANVTEADGSLIWKLPVDFGYTGLYGAGVRAVLRSGAEIKATADVFIRYPEHDVFSDGLCSAWEAYILRNATDPYYFIADLKDSGIDYMHQNTSNMIFLLYQEGSAHFCLPLQESEKRYFEERNGVRLSNPWDTWLKHNSPVYGEIALVSPSAANLDIQALNWFGGPSMAGLMPPCGDYLLGRITGEGTVAGYIYPATRAAVCYRNGVQVDAEKFPEAAHIYARGSEILAQILTDGMNDYQKVKAIHDWMLADGRTHTQAGDFKSLTAEEQEYAISTCNGFLKGYGGDCMGWSDTFRVLCGMAGVQCSVVSCSSNAGGSTDAIDIFDHRFNIAVLDGEPYYFDVYWDGAGSGYDKPPYTYFAMTTKEAAKSHTWLSYEAWGPQDAVSVKYQTNPVTGALVNE